MIAPQLQELVLRVWVFEIVVETAIELGQTIWVPGTSPRDEGGRDPENRGANGSLLARLRDHDQDHR